jgi:hypothetical protein
VRQVLTLAFTFSTTTLQFIATAAQEKEMLRNISRCSKNMMKSRPVYLSQLPVEKMSPAAAISFTLSYVDVYD